MRTIIKTASTTFFAALTVGAALAAPATSPAARHPELDETMLKAIKAHDLGRVTELLDRGADLNPAGAEDRGYSPLRDAVLGRDTSIAALLIERGADPNDRLQGNLPLPAAAGFNMVDMVEFLVTHGAKTEPGPEGVPLVIASERGYIRVVRVLLAHGADVNAPAGRGDTALHRAAANGAAEVVAILIASGADVGAKTKDGKTALDLARAAAMKAAQRKDEASASRNAAYGAVIHALWEANTPSTRPAGTSGK